jgi:ferrochelatase
MTNKKYAVVLFNLGGPDSLDAVEPFLFNLFYDPAIISVPNPIRFFLAKLISKRRAPHAKEIYKHMGGKSPIRELTIEQAESLEKELNQSGMGEYKVFISMRYWHPFSSETVTEVKKYNPDEVLLLPLYPQFSTSTTGSSIRNWQEESKKQGLSAASKVIGCYSTNTGFVKAYAELIKEKYQEAAKFGTPKLLFSAHGLPVKLIKAGDPYQNQVEKSTAAIVKELNIENLDYIITYQSKVGPLEWLTPSTDSIIEQTAKEGRVIIIVPVAFVSEHSETLVELDIEYRELAEKNGAKGYFRVPAVATHSTFIKGLAELCLKANANIAPGFGEEYCADKFKKCICKGLG